uniref:Uncharacterized protein n=1 Tax=Timema tahoe TaxID=61484 RepID=A0A7R9IDI8_9NEOP|nr:unnamed protein product [Timema tahoe]
MRLRRLERESTSLVGILEGYGSSATCLYMRLLQQTKSTSNCLDSDNRNETLTLSAWQQLLQKENTLSVQYSANVTATDPELIRKLDLIVHVGEALLPENERIALTDAVQKGCKSVTIRTVDTDVVVLAVASFGKLCSDELWIALVSGQVFDLRTTLVNSQDPGEILELWTKWMDISSPFRHEFVSILESVNDVASVNKFLATDLEVPGLIPGASRFSLKAVCLERGQLSLVKTNEELLERKDATDADSYWLMQTEFPGSYDDARKLWEGIKPLYLKLQSYVRSRLASRYGEQAFDNSTDIPAHLLGWFTVPRSFNMIKASLNRILRRGDNKNESRVESNLTLESRSFTLVSRVIESASLIKELVQDRCSPSGVYEAAVGLSSLLASSRSYLSSLELLTEEDPSTPTLLLLQALRTLPRLPYYLAADLSRLDLLRFGNFTGQQVVQSWDRHREEFQQISTSGGEEGGWDLMFDDQITSNKPYLGQLLQEGMSLKWPELLEKHLQIFGLDGGPLLRYFKPLEDFLDRQGSPERLNPEGRSGDSLTPAIVGTGVNVNSTTNTTSPKTTSVGSAILIGCATVAAIGIVTTLFLIGRKRFKRGGHEYQIAKSEPI